MVRQASKRKAVRDQVIHLTYPLGTSIADLRRLLAKHWKIGLSRITIQQQRHHAQGASEGDQIPLVTLADQLIIDNLKLIRLLVDWQQQPTCRSKKRKFQDRDSAQQTAPPLSQCPNRTEEAMLLQTQQPPQLQLTSPPDTAREDGIRRASRQSYLQQHRQRVSNHIHHIVASVQALPDLMEEAILQGGGKEQQRSSAIRKSTERRINELA
eukprot:6480700-Amphidinium_carterae.1